MAAVLRFSPTMHERLWTEEEKEDWMAAHGGTPTHVVTFEPMYHIEVCVPPWEHPDRLIACSAVAWGKSMARTFEGEPFGAAPVVAAHHEANSLEVSIAARSWPRLQRVT